MPTRLRLEVLEDRTVPADLTRAAPGGRPTNRANPLNWYITGTTKNPTAAPTVNDTVPFDGTSNAACFIVDPTSCKGLAITAAYTGSINLGVDSLTVDAGAGSGSQPAGTLTGGGFTGAVGGSLVVLRGSVTDNGTNFGGGFNVNVGGGPGGDPATLTMNGGNFQGRGAGKPLDTVNVNGNGTLTVLAPLQLGNNLEVNPGGKATFAQSAGTVSLLNGAIASVSFGGTLGLDNAMVSAAQPATTHVDNYGTVQKTGGGTTDVQVGLVNEAGPGTILSVNGGLNSFLEFDGTAPGSAGSVYQKGGETDLDNQSTLYLIKGYVQDGGVLNVEGSGSGATTASLYGPNTAGQGASINAGKVVLGTETAYHQSTLKTNTSFIFGASSEFDFGINPNKGTIGNDLLKSTADVEIETGAKAVLDVPNLGGAVPSQAWVFMQSTFAVKNSIKGTFAVNLGGKPYTAALDATNTLYQLQT